jgi:hypothetical protein
MYSHKSIIFLIVALIIISVFFFSVIYLINEHADENYQDAFYTSIQIQTSIGMSNASDRRPIRNWITAQSIIAYMLNIILVIYLSVALIRV